MPPRLLAAERSFFDNLKLSDQPPTDADLAAVHPPDGLLRSDILSEVTCAELPARPECVTVYT